jgi:hypothetical protein
MIMTPYKEQRINGLLEGNRPLGGIRIRVPQRRINNYFSGSPSKLFRMLKNGLYSIGGVTNREFFSGWSGVYFSRSDSNDFEMVILYDKEQGIPDTEEAIQRIKKLTGIDTEIELGDLEGFRERIDEITRIRTQVQLFGSAYFSEPD